MDGEFGATVSRARTGSDKTGQIPIIGVFLHVYRNFHFFRDVAENVRRGDFRLSETLTLVIGILFVNAGVILAKTLFLTKKHF